MAIQGRCAPRVQGQSVSLTAEERTRVRRVVRSLGITRAVKELGVAFYTLEAACDPNGRFRGQTRERLLTSLADVEKRVPEVARA